MKRVEAAHRFDVPVERGFAFITDTANWSKFWRGHLRLEAFRFRGMHPKELRARAHD